MEWFGLVESSEREEELLVLIRGVLSVSRATCALFGSSVAGARAHYPSPLRSRFRASEPVWALSSIEKMGDGVDLTEFVHFC